MVPILRTIRHPRHPGSTVTIHIRTHHSDQHICRCTCHRPTSFSNFLSFEQNQRKSYREILIAGDLADGDLVRSVIEGHVLLSDDISTFDTAEFVYGNDTIYFAQPIPSQFVPGGSGAGNFNPPPRMGLKGPPNNVPVLTGKDAPKRGNGAVLRYAPPAHVAWHPDIHLFQVPPVGSQDSLCETAKPRSQHVNQTNVPSLNQFTNLSLLRAFFPPESPNTAYAFVPRDFLQGLLSAALSKVDPSTLSYYGEFLSAPLAFFVPTICTTAACGIGDGTTKLVSIDQPYPTGDQGWVTVETLFIHVNTSYTPSGRFPVYTNDTSTNSDGVNITAWFQIGHDAAVCVQKYEPWIIEAYNTSTGSSFALQIVGKGDDSTSLSPSGNIRGTRIANTRYLNATGKDIPFSAAYKKGVIRMGEAGLNQSSSIVPVAPTPVVGPVMPSWLHPSAVLVQTQPRISIVSLRPSR